MRFEMLRVIITYVLIMQMMKVWGYTLSWLKFPI